jgi:hypothetical protein
VADGEVDGGMGRVDVPDAGSHGSYLQNGLLLPFRQ